MRVIFSSELHRKLATMPGRVNEDHEPVIVTRDPSRAAAPTSLGDFAPYEETLLLQSLNNPAQFLESAAALEMGGSERPLVA